MPKRELSSPSLPPAFHKSGTPPALGEGQAGSLLAEMPVWEAGRTVRKLNMDRAGSSRSRAHTGRAQERPTHLSFPPTLVFLPA